MKHFLSLCDFSHDALTSLLDRADELRACWIEHRMPQNLQGQRVALWFDGHGFRNRIAFEVGAVAMGATVSYIPGELGVHEPIEDIAGYLGNWFSCLVIRAKRHDDLDQVASASPIPIINARTEKNHPCEILGDLHYIRRYRGSLDGLRVVFVGELANMCNSWFEAAQAFPIQVTQVCPAGYEADLESLPTLNRPAAGTIHVTNDLDRALRNADLIYTDCWPKPTPDNDANVIRSHFLPYQIQPAHLSALGERGLFLPCPPVTRGEEVSATAMQSPLCKNHEAKDSLLHVQNAILEMVMASSV